MKHDYAAHLARQGIVVGIENLEEVIAQHLSDLMAVLS